MLPASIDKTDKRISPDLILSLHVLHQTLAHNNTSVIQHLLFYHKFVLENAEIQLNNNEHSFKRKNTLLVLLNTAYLSGFLGCRLARHLSLSAKATAL